MKEYFVDLTDGTRLEIKVNFGTLYYLQNTKGFYRLAKKAEKSKNLLTERENMDLAAALIYAILRSNGRAVSFDEAICLIPPDMSSIEDMLNGFKEKYEEYAKKKRAKTMNLQKQ